MKEIPKTRKDKMGRLNNQMVKLIDSSDLTPLEIITVLRMIVHKVERLLEVETVGK